MDIAIAKAGEDSFNGSTSVDDLSSYKYTNQQPIRQPPPNAYGLGYGPYQSVPWGQPLPPESVCFVVLTLAHFLTSSGYLNGIGGIGSSWLL